MVGLKCLPCKESLGDLGLVSLEQGWLWGNLTAFCKSLIRNAGWWEATNTTITQETWVYSRKTFNSEGSQKMERCPERLWRLHPQRWLRPRWIHAWKTQCNIETGCALNTIGSDDLYRSLPDSLVRHLFFLDIWESQRVFATLWMMAWENE